MKMSGDTVLRYLIDLLETYLNELTEDDRGIHNKFIEGQCTAYVECLEIIQMWDGAEDSGLNWDIEARYPL